MTEGMDTMVANATTYAGPERRCSENTLRRMLVSEMSLEELRREILTDELTGLPNRRTFQERQIASKEFVLLVDACGLKYVNDTYGLAAGDALLVLVGSFLRRLAEQRWHAQAFRLGGRSDEFVVVGPAGVDDQECVLAQLESDLARLPHHWNSWKDGAGDTWRLRGVTVTWAVGQCLDSADMALRTAKAARQEAGTRAVRGERPPGLHVWKAAEVLR